jgi:hypothetical protein
MLWSGVLYMGLCFPIPLSLSNGTMMNTQYTQAKDWVARMRGQYRNQVSQEALLSCAFALFFLSTYERPALVDTCDN